MRHSTLAITVTTVVLLQNETVYAGRNRRDRDGGGNNNQDRTPSDLGFFNQDSYQAQSAVDKLELLWTQSQVNQNVMPQPWAATPSLFTRQMGKTFSLAGDELPQDRPKINHSQGTVAKVEWEDLGGHPYTGLYQGAQQGLIRLSEGNFLLPEAPGLTPTLAIKFLRDGMPSVNHLANTSFEPSDSWNFFANDFPSHIPLFVDECAQDSIQRKFAEARGRVGTLGLAEFARVNADGSVVDTSLFDFPFEIVFAPNQELAALWPDEREYDEEGNEVPFYEQLQQIPTGSVLFEVMARDFPDDLQRFPQGSTVRHIGNIRSTTEMITSDFGDRRLFFQHEKATLDFDTKPEFKRYHEKVEDGAFNVSPIPVFPADDVTAKAWVRGQLEEYGCPFAWLFNQPFAPIFD